MLENIEIDFSDQTRGMRLRSAYWQNHQECTLGSLMRMLFAAGSLNQYRLRATGW